MFVLIGAALTGLLSAPLWASQAIYLDRIARYHAQHKHQTVQISVSLFFGIFFAWLGTSLIWGNLTSYIVLHQSNHSQEVNCGINFDPRSAMSANNTESVNQTTVSYCYCLFL
jgi:hypothetical protein